jgi:AAA+ superfamily predicted ATPase
MESLDQPQAPALPPTGPVGASQSSGPSGTPASISVDGCGGSVGSNDDMGPIRQRVQSCKRRPSQHRTMGDMKGMDAAIQKLRAVAVTMKFADPEIVQESFRGGVLIHGPQGTGKTALVNAFARMVGCTFYEILGADILSHLLGGTEKCVFQTEVRTYW